MFHQRSTESLPLVGIYYNESYLGRLGLHHDITSAADDRKAVAFVHHRYQSDMIYEVDIQEERDFLLRKAALCPEETTKKGLRTGPLDGCKELIPVLRSQRPDFDLRPSRSTSTTA